jgi:hypothetical protein
MLVSLILDPSDVLELLICLIQKDYSNSKQLAHLLSTKFYHDLEGGASTNQRISEERHVCRGIKRGGERHEFNNDSNCSSYSLLVSYIPICSKENL